MMTPERPDDWAADSVWAQLVHEAEGLIALGSEEMSAEQLDRLEEISDGLLHLIACATDSIPTRDYRLLQELARRRVRGVGTEVLTAADRQQLRQRIVAGMHAERLRVRDAETPALRCRMENPQVLTPEVLRAAEQRHHAIVVPELAIAAGAGCELWDVECDTTIALSADLPRGPYIALEVTGDSMLPLLHSGDTVLVRVEEKATAGSVVVARDPDHGYVVKEVARLTAHGIELLSLNPSFPPVRVPHGAGAVLGTVVMKWCPHGGTAPRSSR